ncbi:MAG: hypothetical protein AB1404_05345 [Spirochaetota bacterium]
MPKPKRKRATKSSSSDPVAESAPQSRDNTPAIGFATRLTGSEERAAFELPDLGALAAKLRRDLDREPDLARRLRLYDLALMELDAARDKGSRLYTLQANAGELVNPEDNEAYAGRLVDLIAKLRLEREQSRLDQEASPPPIPPPDAERMVRSSVPSASSFAPVSSPKVYPEILTASEIWEYLRLTEDRFYQTYESLGLPVYREGRQLRCRKTKLDDWIEKKENEALQKASGASRSRSQKPKKVLANTPSTPISTARDNEASVPTPEAFQDRGSAYSLTGLDEAISALVVMLVNKRWLDPESGPSLGEWLAKPKDFSGPPLNWLVGTKTLYSLVVCLCHANILVLEPGSKKKGAAAPQYEPAILRAFHIAGNELKGGINRTVMKHEAAVKHFREVLTSYAIELHGADRRTDSFLDNIDLYYLHRQKKDFSPVLQRLEQGISLVDDKSRIGVFSVLDDQVLILLRNLIAEYPALFEIEPTL